MGVTVSSRALDFDRGRTPGRMGSGGEYSLAAASSSRRPSSDDRHCGPTQSVVSVEETSGVFRRPEALSMQVSQLEWIVTLGVTIAVLLFDVVVIGRRPHEPSKRETSIALTVYVGLAV